MKLGESLQKMIDRCSRCGTCQAHCPLYLSSGLEPLVARGKVELLELLSGGKLQWNDRLAEIFSTCLLCGNCGDNCPNGVRVDRLVQEARRDLVAARGLPVLKRTVFQLLLKGDGRLGTMARLLYFYQKSGLRKLVHTTGMLKLLPGDASARESLLPVFAAGQFRKLVPQITRAENGKIKAGYFTGCMTDHVYHRTGYSVIKLLTRNGVDVVIPEQGCCGLPALAGGDYDTARELARRNIISFMRYGIDYIVVDCAGCLGTWLEYPQLTGDNHLAGMAGQVMDVSRFLVEVLGFCPHPASENTGIVTYHDPCHLKKVEGGKEYPRTLLKKITGENQFVELPAEAGMCCGSAGSFSLEHYRLSQAVVQPKVQALKKIKPDYIATGCPACMAQLEHAIKKASLPVRVVHTVELLARFV